MEDTLDISEVRLIIRNLITFIVIEGKEYVNDEQKQAYISGYLLVLVKTINLIDEKERVSVVETIAKDISEYLI